MFEEQRVEIDGVTSVVRQAGDVAAEEAVVFVHGNPGPSDDWEFIASDVAAFARVVLPDLPAFGRADRPKKFPFSVEGYSRYLGKLLERLGVQRAHLVLHDFGGPWGLHWASEHPEAVRSITCVNTGLMAGYEWHHFAKVWQTPVLGEAFQALMPKWLMKKAVNRENGRPLPDEWIERTMQFSDWAQKRAVLALYRAEKDMGQRATVIQPVLRALDVPVCVVFGADDPYIPAKWAPAQTDTFPRAEIHLLDKCGHWPFLDAPDRVRSHMLPFLKRHAGS